MSQVVIDTDKIWSEIRVPLAIIVVIAIIIIAGITLYDKGWADAATAQTAASAPVATVIAQPTAIPAPRRQDSRIFGQVHRRFNL